MKGWDEAAPAPDPNLRVLAAEATKTSSKDRRSGRAAANPCASAPHSDEDSLARSRPIRSARPFTSASPSPCAGTVTSQQAGPHPVARRQRRRHVVKRRPASPAAFLWRVLHPKPMPALRTFRVQALHRPTGEILHRASRLAVFPAAGRGGALAVGIRASEFGQHGGQTLKKRDSIVTVA